MLTLNLTTDSNTPQLLSASTLRSLQYITAVTDNLRMSRNGDIIIIIILLLLLLLLYQRLCIVQCLLLIQKLSLC
jgi:hypothetical protein